MRGNELHFVIGLDGGANFADGPQSDRRIALVLDRKFESPSARSRGGKGHIAECKAGHRSAHLGVGRAAGCVEGFSLQACLEAHLVDLEVRFGSIGSHANEEGSGRKQIIRKLRGGRADAVQAGHGQPAPALDADLDDT